MQLRHAPVAAADTAAASALPASISPTSTRSKPAARSTGSDGKLRDPYRAVRRDAARTLVRLRLWNNPDVD